MQDSFHNRIKKEYAAAVIELTPAQQLALDKELDAIKNNPSYLKKWDEVKSRFKKS